MKFIGQDGHHTIGRFLLISQRKFKGSEFLVFFQELTDSVFIFCRIQGAGAVYQKAAFFYIGSSAGKKFLLERREFFQVLFLPVPADFRFMGKNAQAGTGSIQKNLIVSPKESRERFS